MEVHKRPSYKAVLACLVIFAMVLTLIFVHTSGHWVGKKVIKYSYMAPRETPHQNQKKNAVNQHHASESSWDWELETEQFSSSSMGIFDSQKYSSENKNFPQGMLSGEELSPDLKPETKQSKTRNLTNQFALWTNVIQGALQWDQTTEISTDTRHRPHQQNAAALHGTTSRALQHAIRVKLKESARISREHAERNWYYFNDRNRTEYKTMPLHNSSDPEWKQEEAVIFNRVGKCGSRSVIRLLEKLSDLNNFNLISSVVYNMTTINLDWQKYIVQTLDAIRTPYLFQRHLHFINFGYFNLRQPLYINIIRDPLNRFVSNYYFKRFGDGKSDRNFKGSVEAKNRSVTDCILRGYKECMPGGAMYIIPFFCGQQKACRKPSQWAVDRAKTNVEKYFIVVGILEDLENTFRLFEKLLPRFFNGAVEAYEKQEKDGMKPMATKKKEKPSDRATAVMKHLMRYEYDFYDWVKERFEQMKKQHGIV